MIEIHHENEVVVLVVRSQLKAAPRFEWNANKPVYADAIVLALRAAVEANAQEQLKEQQEMYLQGYSDGRSRRKKRYCL
jgi:hypothetical protein